MGSQHYLMQRLNSEGLQENYYLIPIRQQRCPCPCQISQQTPTLGVAFALFSYTCLRHHIGERGGFPNVHLSRHWSHDPT